MNCKHHPENLLVLPVKRDSQNVFVDLSGFKQWISECAEDLVYGVLPGDDDGLSYLRLATQIYSKLVIFGKPCLNVVIYRRECVEEPNANSPCLASGTSDILLSSSVLSQNAASVGSHGYKFGDGSSQFYNKYGVVAVGGTFDRLHAGHRLLLTAAAWATQQTLRIGITSDVLLKNKKYKDFIASLEDRSRAAEEFARQVKPTLPRITITELRDPAGPSATDPSIQAIVVSSETASGARRINDIRVSAGLNRMAIIEVDVLDTQGEKLSSSALREAESARCHGLV